MSGDTISIGELERSRKGWPAELTPVLDADGNWYGEFDHSDNEHGNEGYIECSSSDMDEAPRFAALIAAEHNAMPTFIAIVKAALEMENLTIGTAKRRAAAELYYATLAKVRP